MNLNKKIKFPLYFLLFFNLIFPAVSHAVVILWPSNYQGFHEYVAYDAANANCYDKYGPNSNSGVISGTGANDIALFVSGNYATFTCYKQNYVNGLPVWSPFGTLSMIGRVIPAQTLPVPDPSCKVDAVHLSACIYDPTKASDYKKQGKDCDCEHGNPINHATGNKRQSEKDYFGAGSNSLFLERNYNSSSLRNGRYGNNWAGNYDRVVIPLQQPFLAIVKREDGREFVFTSTTNSVYVTDADVLDTLTPQFDNNNQMIGWQYLVGVDQTLETYDVYGKLKTIRKRTGLVQTLSYSDASTPTSVAPQNDLLINVTDNFNHQLNFAYDSSSRIVQMTDPVGGITTYGYDGNNNLITVTHPDSSVRSYIYNESAYTAGTNLPTALTGIVDENGSRFATFNFDSSGRGISTEHASGVEKYSMAYTSGTQTSVTYPLGGVNTYTFQSILNSIHNTSITQPAGAGSGAATSTTTYDSNGNTATGADFNGTLTTYTYDLTRNLETSRVEASGTPQARTISTSWHATYRLPLKIAEPLLLTSFTYDASGNLLTKSLQATIDATGASGLSPTTTGLARTWTYTYNSVGQVLTVTGPRTDVLDKTTFTYDTSGNLSTITNAAGQVTTLSSYDNNGRVGHIVDANGLSTSLIYSSRGWLTSKTVTSGSSTLTTVYAYDAVGQLTQVTLPDSSTIIYTYDAAHRLTNIADSLGNSIAYTLDNMGNRLTEKVQDPGNNLVRQTTRIIDALNRLQTITGGVQ